MTESEAEPKRRRWWLIGICGALVLIVLVVAVAFLVGSMLGEEVTSSVSRSFDYPPEAVWATINDYKTVPVSGSLRKMTVPLPNEANGPAWTEDIGQTVITVRTVESEEPVRLVRTFEDSVVPMTARYEYLLEPEGDGTKVTLNSTTIIKDGTWHVPIFRLTLHMDPNVGPRLYLKDVETHLQP